MPQRNRERTITGGPQGDDAVVVVFMPTIEQLNAGLDTSDIPDDEPAENAAEAVAVTLSRMDKIEKKAREFFARHVRSWNWVDDNSDPLPQPHGNPDVFGLLLQDELAFIAKYLRGQAEQQVKNRKK